MEDPELTETLRPTGDLTEPAELLRFPCAKVPFAENLSATPTPEPPTVAVSVVLEARMSASEWGGTGRPTNEEAQRRKGRFLTLIADGHQADDAAAEAGISLKRALRIVTESDFREIVQALRDDAEAA